MKHYAETTRNMKADLVEGQAVIFAKVDGGYYAATATNMQSGNVLRKMAELGTDLSEAINHLETHSKGGSDGR